MIAHVAGVPVEEMLTAAPATGAALLLAGAWISAQLRHLGHGR